LFSVSISYLPSPSKCDASTVCVYRYGGYNTDLSVRLRWAVEKYSQTRLKRVVIYNFEDLLVSFGGTTGLFLGCSIISIVEICYFFTLRLVRYEVTLSKAMKTPTF
jgi:hypothetical protein